MLANKQNFRKWYTYKLPVSILIIILQFMTFIYQKKIDDVIISFKGAFDKLNDLLKAPTDIWNNNEKHIYLKRAVKASLTNICRICPDKLQKKIT